MGKRGLKNVAYDYLLDAITSYEMKPGQAIVEQDVSDKLGISRTPIREALKQLESEGLVRHFPSRGTFVTNLTVQDVESLAYLAPCGHIGPLELEDRLGMVENPLFRADTLGHPGFHQIGAGGTVQNQRATGHALGKFRSGHLFSSLVRRKISWSMVQVRWTDATSIFSRTV